MKPMLGIGWIETLPLLSSLATFRLMSIDANGKHRASASDNGLAKPIIGLVLLALFWDSHETGAMALNSGPMSVPLRNWFVKNWSPLAMRSQ